MKSSTVRIILLNGSKMTRLRYIKGANQQMLMFLQGVSDPQSYIAMNVK